MGFGALGLGFRGGRGLGFEGHFRRVRGCEACGSPTKSRSPSPSEPQACPGARPCIHQPTLQCSAML